MGIIQVSSSTDFPLDSVIAMRIMELRLGLNENSRHTWKAISIAVCGYECQMNGKELCRLAKWSLGTQWKGDY